MKTKKLMMVALVSSTLALSGCGAMSTAIKKRNLEVKTQMSETIWLEPAWICPYISRHLLSLNPLLACCRRYSRGER